MFLVLLLAAQLAGEIPITTSSPQALESFQRGRERFEASEFGPAAREFARALQLDPGFVLARSYLGATTPGADGLKMTEEAAAGAGKLPEAERLLVEANAAQKRGDEEGHRQLWRRIAEDAPNDWRSQFWLGRIAAFDHKSNAALVALKKAYSLNPKAGVVLNQLGYVYADLNDFEHAISAMKQYVALAPKDSNPADSLGEIYLWSGNLLEAGRWFQKSAELDPTQWMAFIGVAQVHFLGGKWAEGRKATELAQEATGRGNERAQATRYLAWSYMAEGKPAEAMKVLDKLEGDALSAKAGLQYAEVPLQRARMLIEGGRYAEALKLAASAQKRAAAPDISGNDRNGLRRRALTLQCWAQAKLLQAAAAQASLSALEAESSANPSNTDLRSRVHFAAGAVALARKDPQAAVEAFARCASYDYYCRWQQVLVLEQTNPAAAAAAREDLLRQKRRDQIYLDQDPMYLYVYWKLQKPG